MLAPDRPASPVPGAPPPGAPGGGGAPTWGRCSS
jgi:hypothetical protein